MLCFALQIILRYPFTDLLITKTLYMFLFTSLFCNAEIFQIFFSFVTAEKQHCSSLFYDHKLSSFRLFTKIANSQYVSGSNDYIMIEQCELFIQYTCTVSASFSLFISFIQQSSVVKNMLKTFSWYEFAVKKRLEKKKRKLAPNGI